LIPCPEDVADKLSCFNTTDWTLSFPFSLKVTIIKRHSTTAFDRFNYTILDVLDLSHNWEHTNYSPSDFNPIFDAVFSVDITLPGWNISTQCDFLHHTWKYFASRVNSTRNSGAVEGLAKLRSLFAVPVLEFNNVVYDVSPLPTDLGKAIGIANVSYRVST
jgi:hypothetical protein